MKTRILSWLPTTKRTAASPSPFTDDTASNSSRNNATSSVSSLSSRDISNTILQTNYSIQTMPSVPSLQKHTSESLHISVSHHCITTIKPQTDPVTCLAVHGTLLYAATGHVINVYDRTTSAHLHSFNGQDSSTGFVKSIDFSGDKILTAHQDGKIRVWKLTAKNHKLLTTLPTVADKLRRFAIPKNYVKIRRHRKKLWIEHADAVTAIAVSGGDKICSVSWDRTLKIWRGSDLRCLESIKVHDDAVNAVVISVDGTIYTGSADRRIRVWFKPANAKRHEMVATLEKHRSAVNALALNDDGSVLFSGSCDRSILVWEIEDTGNHMAVTGALRGHGGAVLSLVNVCGCDVLVSGSSDRTVRVWQRGGLDGKYDCLAVMEGHLKPVKSLVVVPDGESNDTVSVVSGSLDGEIWVWQVSVSSFETCDSVSH